MTPEKMEKEIEGMHITHVILYVLSILALLLALFASCFGGICSHHQMNGRENNPSKKLDIPENNNSREKLMQSAEKTTQEIKEQMIALCIEHYNRAQEGDPLWQERWEEVWRDHCQDQDIFPSKSGTPSR